MRLTLKPHLDMPSSAITAIEVETWRADSGGLVLRYRATGEMAKLKLPDLADWSRADRLWEQTCFEAFARTADGAGYYEFNFSPSSRWAAYHFDAYRQGMRIAADISPRLEMAYSTVCYELRAYVPREQLAELPQAGFWRLALSAVIEQTNGERSYWALAHPPGAPDFHHADGFICNLAELA